MLMKRPKCLWCLSSHKSATFLDSLAGPYSMLANKVDTLGSVTRRMVSIASTEVGGTSSVDGVAMYTLHMSNSINSNCGGTGFSQQHV